MRRKLVLLVMSAVLVISGCATNKTRVAEGAGIGEVLGAGLGYVVGKQSGHGGEGAGIGAATGIVAGSLIGSQVNKPGAQTSQAVQNNQAMSLQEVVSLTQRGINEDVIVDKIRMSGTRYTLTPDQLNYLQQNNVGLKVIAALQGM